MALYDPQQHRSHGLSAMGYDPGVHVPLPMRPWPCGMLGYPDQALQRSHEALTLAQELSHPFSLALALYFAAWLHQLPPGVAGRPKSGQRQPWPSPPSRGFRFWSRDGDDPAGLGAGRAGAESRRGLRRCARAWRPGGPRGQSCYGRIVWPCWPRRMGRLGRSKRGCALLAEALTVAQRHGGASLRSRAVSAQGGVAAAARSCGA